MKIAYWLKSTSVAVPAEWRLNMHGPVEEGVVAELELDLGGSLHALVVTANLAAVVPGMTTVALNE